MAKYFKTKFPVRHLACDKVAAQLLHIILVCNAVHHGQGADVNIAVEQVVPESHLGVVLEAGRVEPHLGLARLIKVL